MVSLGILTLLNLKQMKNLGWDPRSSRRREIQFIRMLLIQAISYLLLNVPLCILYLMIVLPFGYPPTEKFIFACTLLSYPFNFADATPDFLYILSAKQYREEFFQLFQKLSTVENRNRVKPISTLHEHRRVIPNSSSSVDGIRRWWMLSQRILCYIDCLELMQKVSVVRDQHANGTLQKDMRQSFSSHRNAHTDTM